MYESPFHGKTSESFGPAFKFLMRTAALIVEEAAPSHDAAAQPKYDQRTLRISAAKPSSCQIRSSRPSESVPEYVMRIGTHALVVLVLVLFRSEFDDRSHLS